MGQIMIFITTSLDTVKSVLHHFSREPDHNPHTPHTTTHTLPSTSIHTNHPTNAPTPTHSTTRARDSAQAPPLGLSLIHI